MHERVELHLMGRWGRNYGEMPASLQDVVRRHARWVGCGCNGQAVACLETTVSRIG